MEKLQKIDEYFFRIINSSGWEQMDEVMILISTKWFWIPLYIYILHLLYKQFSNQFLKILLSLGLLIFLADFGSVHLFKEVFERVRPCNMIPALDSIRLIDGYNCGTGFSFISSHAANSFAIAFFISIIFRNLWGFIYLFSWAVLIGYSRIYLGVHFPFDIVGGMFWAIIVSLLTHKFLSLKIDATI